MQLGMGGIVPRSQEGASHGEEDCGYIALVPKLKYTHETVLWFCGASLCDGSRCSLKTTGMEAVPNAATGVLLVLRLEILVAAILGEV